jgi:hypothetical protein
MFKFRLPTPSTVAPARFKPHRLVPGHAAVRRIAAVLGLACFGLLAGCVNLQAVSAYTTSAGAVVADTSAAARWQQSELRLRALGLPGDSDQVCALGRSGRAPQAEFDAALVEIAAVHRLLGDYFQALGLLASDKLPLPSTALAGSLSAVKAAGVPVSPADEAALKSLATLLGRALDGYRQRELRRLIELSHPDVDTSLVLLQRLAALYLDEIDGERRQAALYWRCQLSANGEVVDKYWGRREFKRVANAYAAELATLTTYGQALAQVRRDHAALRETLALDGDALKQALAGLMATRTDLDAARTALAKL